MSANGRSIDNDTFDSYRLLKIEFPEELNKYFWDQLMGSLVLENSLKHNKPLSGAIVKPKTGISPETLLEMVKELVDGGCDFKRG